jgi:hypothetical protein
VCLCVINADQASHFVSRCRHLAVSSSYILHGGLPCFSSQELQTLTLQALFNVEAMEATDCEIVVFSSVGESYHLNEMCSSSLLDLRVLFMKLQRFLVVIPLEAFIFFPPTPCFPSFHWKDLWSSDMAVSVYACGSVCDIGFIVCECVCSCRLFSRTQPCWLFLSPSLCCVWW